MAGQRLAFEAGNDGAEASFGGHQAEAGVAGKFVHAPDQTFHLDPVGIEVAVGEVFEIDIGGGGKVGGAEDFDGGTEDFGGEAAGAGAAGEFDPLAGLDVFLNGVEVHVDGVAAFLEEAVAPFGVGVGDDAAEAGGKMLGGFFGAELKDVGDLGEDGGEAGRPWRAGRRAGRR